MIYYEAVRYALQYNEFFMLEEVFRAKLLLQHGEERAWQIPKLPDYAVVDTTTPPDFRYPGKIVLAGFFNEAWQL